MKNSRRAPLNKIAAHQADNSAAIRKFAANPVELLPVPQVKGVILTDDADDFQKIPSFSKIFPIQGLRNPVKCDRILLAMVIIPQTEEKENHNF